MGALARHHYTKCIGATNNRRIDANLAAWRAFSVVSYRNVSLTMNAYE